MVGRPCGNTTAALGGQVTYFGATQSQQPQGAGNSGQSTNARRSRLDYKDIVLREMFPNSLGATMTASWTQEFASSARY